MSPSPEKSPVAEDGPGDEPAQLETAEEVIGNHEISAGLPEGGRIVELLEEERTGTITPAANGFGGKEYRTIQGPDEASEDGSVDQAPRRVESPSGSVLSNPDDSPSVQVHTHFCKMGNKLIVLGVCSFFSRK
jgi:hypothetical protein